MSDLVERLRAHKADIWNWNGEAMTAWDSWRSAIAKGDKSSWPRDAFESLIGEYGADMEKAADRIAQLEAEVLTWQGHAKTAIWGDSEECKSLSAEVDRLVRSRNKWGQRYNKLLLKIRAGENGETDDPASWQLRMALDDANVKNDEAADRIEQLEAALRPLACTCEVRHQVDCSRSEVDCRFWNARAALEGRT